MSFIIIFSALAVVLFLAAFVSKRRFGVLGLALLAGATLSGLWVETVTMIVAGLGVRSSAPPLETIVEAAITLFPALLLLLSGPTYRTAVQRIVGALAFTLLALALLLQPLGSALVITGVGQTVYTVFMQYHATIITACVIFAILDLFGAKTPPHAAKH
jgi:hypothetical protein